MRSSFPLLLLPLLTSATLRPFPGKVCEFCRDTYKSRRMGSSVVDADDPDVASSHVQLLQGLISAPSPGEDSDSAVVERWGWGQAPAPAPAPAPGRLERRAGYTHWPTMHPGLPSHAHAPHVLFSTRKRHPPFLPPVARFRSDSLGLGLAGLGLTAGAGYPFYPDRMDVTDMFDEGQSKGFDAAALAGEEMPEEPAGPVNVANLLQELVRLRGERAVQDDQVVPDAVPGADPSSSRPVVRYGILS